MKLFFVDYLHVKLGRVKNKMSFCGKCQQMYASRQSLSQHRKRKHPEGEPKKDDINIDDIINMVSPSPKVPSPKAPKKRLKTKVLEPKKDINMVSPIPKVPSLKAATIPKKVLEPKKKNILTSAVIKDILKPKPLIELVSPSDSESDPETDSDESSEPESSETSDSETSDSETELSENEEVSDNKLMKAFKDLYSKFDDDIEVHNDLVVILQELRRRKCIKRDEYQTFKEGLQKKIELGLYKTIRATADNMTRDDKTQILQLLQGKKDKDAKQVNESVKKYFNRETELGEILNALPKLDDKIFAQRMKIILKQIEKTNNRVEQVLTRLINATERSDVLNLLKQENLITAEQFDKLSIAPNTLSSISKIIQGRGLWL